MIVINYKPLSVNQAWQGKRFKTKEYLNYEKTILLMLPKIKIVEPPYKIELEFGMSSLSDIDNPIKPFLDILQKKYKINDRDIEMLNVVKTKVKKCSEFIKFEIKSTEN